MACKPRLLIVEDDPRLRPILVDFFSNPPQVFRDAHGASAFEVFAAGTGKAADELLQWARAERPFDVVLLDLGLPRTDPSDHSDADVGRELLRSLETTNKGSCNAVIVHTIYDDVPTIIGALKGGAADFLPKPNNAETVFQCVVQVYKKSREGLNRRWAELLQQRSDRRALLSRAQLADEIARVVSGGIGRIVGLTEDLGSLLLEHFHISVERERDNPFCRRIRDVDDTALVIARTCAERRRQLVSSAHDRRRVTVENAISASIERLQAGLALRHLSLQRPTRSYSVHTFEPELGMLLDEMLSAAIKDAPEGARLACEVGQREQFITISVTNEMGPRDSGDDVPETFPPGDRGERPLELAQWLAENVGAHLESVSSGSARTVTLHLPLTADDSPIDDR